METINLKARLLSAGLGLRPEDFSSHETDLYVRYSPTVFSWLQTNYEFACNMTIFYSAIPEEKHARWIDIPFAHDRRKLDEGTFGILKKVAPLQYSEGVLKSASGKEVLETNRNSLETPLNPFERDQFLKMIAYQINCLIPKRNVNGYEILFNTYWNKWQVYLKGALMAEFDPSEEALAIDHAKKG